MKKVIYKGPYPQVTIDLGLGQRSINVSRGKEVSLPGEVAEDFLKNRPKSWGAATGNKPSTENQ